MLSSTLSLAHATLAHYLGRHPKETLEALDPNDVFYDVASRGDIKTFSAVVTYYQFTDPTHKSGWNHLRALRSAALHGHWDLILEILKMDPSTGYEPMGYWDHSNDFIPGLIESAIEGGHFHIIRGCFETPDLKYSITHVNVAVIGKCVQYQRYEILDFYLRAPRDENSTNFLMKNAAAIAMKYLDMNMLSSLLTHFPEYHDVMLQAIKRELPNETYDRPHTGIASRSEFVSDKDIALRYNFFEHYPYSV